MFKKALGTISTRLDVAQSPDKQTVSAVQPEVDSLQRLVGQNASFQFGTNMLLNSGFISPKILAKLNKYRPNPEAMRLLSAIEMGNEALARELAFDPNFLDMNGEFLKSGQAVKVAVEKGMLPLAKDLVSQGFELPESLLIDAIRDEKRDLIRNAIQGQFYGREHCVELDFWYLLHENYFEEAKMLQEIEPLIKQITVSHDLSSPESFESAQKDRYVLASALDAALRRGQDSLATVLLGIDPQLVQTEFITSAIKNSCMEFLKRVWIGDHRVAFGLEVRKRKRKSVMWEQLDAHGQSGTAEKTLKLTSIVEQFLTRKKVAEVKQILQWPEAGTEQGIIKILIDYEQQDLARSLIANNNLILDAEDVISAFEKKQYELCVSMVQNKEARVALDTSVMQAALLKLLENGSTCLPAIEMLNLVSNKNWNLDLTKQLCLTLVSFAKKTTELVVCHAPLLFIALAAEFLTRLSGASLQHENRCLATAKFIIDFGMAVEDSIKEEEELRYFLMQKDSNDRTVLTICSENRFYALLEHDEIGTIVGKMWNGAKKNYGLIGALTVFQSLESPSNSEEAMAFAKPMDPTKPYLFQYEQWTESCSLRFLAQAISTLVHVLIYQILIGLAIQDQTFNNVAADSTCVVYLRISQIWVLGVGVEHFLHLLFSWKAHRSYIIDYWKLVDYIMFIVTILIMVSIQDTLMGPGNAFSFIDPSVFNAILHSIMIVVIWIRFLSVLIGSKTFGPFLRMLFLMVRSTLNFFVIYTCLFICCSAIFTALFNSTSPEFTDFGTSLRSLFQSAMGQFDLTQFSANIGLGGTLLGIFCVLANAVMLNLLVALLANIYEDLIGKVDSEYRAVVISYYNRWSWDQDYGLLIFLPSPFSLIVVGFMPFLMIKNPAKWNAFFSRMLYLIYASAQFLLFAFSGFTMAFLCYFKGFFIYSSAEKFEKKPEFQPIPEVLSPQIVEEAEEEAKGAEADDALEVEHARMKSFNVVRFLVWTAIGIPWLFYSVLRDCRDYWRLLYVSSKESTEIEGTKVNALVTEKFIKDVQLVLKSITVPEIQLDQLIDTWFMVDQSHFHQGDKEEANFSVDSTARKSVALEYFSQFANASSDDTVDVTRMKLLLPKRMGHLYDEDYLNRARHVNVPWFLKGVRKYQQQIGSINIGGLSIPKKAEQKSQATAIDKDQMEKVQREITELEQEFSDLLLSARSIKNEMENKTKVLKTLGSSAKVEDEIPRETLW